jgi:hypothetical protein
MLVVGVYHVVLLPLTDEPHPSPSMPCPERWSRYKARPDFVAIFFQVIANGAELILARKSVNILPNNPSRSAVVIDSPHLTPEPSFVFFTFSLSIDGEGLAREAAGKDVDWSFILLRFELFDI